MNSYESFQRKMYNKSCNIPYKAIKSFEEAKNLLNATVIFEGDDGGTIYLTCPMRLVQCTEKELQQLLEYIDSLFWNDLEMASIYYEVIECNQPVAGGMDGGFVTNGIWIHPLISEFNIEDKVRKIIYKEM